MTGLRTPGSSRRKSTGVSVARPTPIPTNRGRHRRRRPIASTAWLVAPTAAPAPNDTVVARAVDAMKVYGRATPGPGPRRRHRRLPRRPLHRHHGPVGLGQVDAHALPRRARHAHRRARCSSATTTSATLTDKQLTMLRRERIGFVFQAFNLVPTLTALENITLPARPRRPQARPGVARPGRRHRRAGRPAQPPPVRAVRRPAAAGRRRPRPGQPPGRSSSPTSPPATSTRAAGAEILAFLRRAVDELGQTIVMVTHDPVAAGYADAVALPGRRPHRRRTCDDPDGRDGARPHEGIRRVTDMLRITLKGLLGPQAPAASHVRSPSSSASRSSPGRSCWPTPSARRSTTSSPTPTPAPTSIVRSRRTRRRASSARRSGAASTVDSSTTVARSTASRRPSPSSGLRPDRRRRRRPARRQRPAHDRRRTGSRLRRAQPLTIAEGRAPGGDRRGGDRQRSADDGDLAGRRPHAVSDTRGRIEVDDRRHRHVRDGRRPGRCHVRRRSPRRRPSSSWPSAARSTTSRSPPRRRLPGGAARPDRGRRCPTASR